MNDGPRWAPWPLAAPALTGCIGFGGEDDGSWTSTAGRATIRL